MATTETANSKKSQPAEVCQTVAPQEESSDAVESLPSADEPQLVQEEAPKMDSEAPKKKKKGKKMLSYKSMMAGMMTAPNSATKDEKEKEALKKVTGGGAFSKIDKI